MLLKQFPDIQWLKRKIREDFSDRTAVNDMPLERSGWPTVVLNTAVKHTERLDIKGSFSLFFNQSGKSQVRVDGKEQHIHEQCYGLSNAGQHYDLLIDEARPTETLNLHFGQHFFQQSVTALAKSHEALLDNPFSTDSQELNLLIGTRLKTEALSSKLQQLLISYQQPDTVAEEEILFEILSLVLSSHSREIQRSALLPIKSKTSRLEVVHRLMQGRELLHARFDQTVALDELSKVSCLSKFHFLRLFKQFFGVTPHQYQQQLRLERAKALYREGHSLEVIASYIGMENGSSVSRLFRKQTGAYPSQQLQ